MIKRFILTLLAWLGVVITREDAKGITWFFSCRKGGWIPVYPIAGGAPGGDSDTASLSDSLPVVIQSARQVREDIGQDFISTVDRKTLPMGQGRNWNEIDLARISAQAVPEKSELNNPQQLVDTLLSIEATRIGVHLVITAEAAHYVATNVAAQWGTLMQNAIRRYIDRLGLNLYDGATVTGGGTTTTLSSGVVAAMVAQIQGDTDESALETEQVYAFVHSFQLYDVRTEVTGGVATYPLPAGLTAEAFAKGSRVIREIGGAQVHLDNNVRIDATPDGHGGVHAKSGVVFVQVAGKKRAWTETPGNRGG
ncbi:MAG: hypothetical protein U0990_12675, partial [Candidatus Nanopelagicales bacterium]|nr:hypothetical protein [Candidatus Nanopelagicales bacterium]